VTFLAVLGAVLLAVDLAWRQGLASGAPYVLLVALSLRLRSRRVTLRVTLAASVLTALGLLRSRPGGSLAAEVLGRLLTLAVIWGVAVEGLKLLNKRTVRPLSEREAETAPDQRNRDRARLRRQQKRDLQIGLAQGVFHAINNTLMVIQSDTDRLQERLEPAHAARPLVEDIEKAAEEIGVASERWQRFMREEAGSGPPVELSRLLDEGLPLLRHLLPGMFQIAVDRPPSPDQRLLVSVSADALFQIVLSLGMLVREALPKGGELRMTVTTTAPPAGQSRGEHDGLVRLALEAIGESLEERPAWLVDPGEPTPAALTLQVLRDLAEEHGGHFEARVQSRGRLQLAVTLPYTVGVEQPASATGVVMVVDRHDYTRTLTAGVLRGEGLTVAPCRSATEALDAWRLHHGQPRVIVVEETALDGLETAQLAELEELSQDGHVILTRGAEAGTASRRLPDCSRWLRKPYAMRELTALVRLTLQAQSGRDNER
jgi:CheY-like chemotaxis protein